MKQKDLEKYLTEAEREIVLLTELFQAKFLSGEILNDQNGQSFLEALTRMSSTVKKKIENQKKSEQWKIKHEEEKYKNMNKVCEHCRQVRAVTVVGEGRNNNGHRVHEYQCNHCRQRFFDPIPFEDEHYVAFLEKFIQQYEAGEQEAFLLAKRLLITKDNFQHVKTNLDNYKLAIEKEKEADELLKTLTEVSDAHSKKMLKNLYDIYGKVLSFNPAKYN